MRGVHFTGLVLVGLFQLVALTSCDHEEQIKLRHRRSEIYASKEAKVPIADEAPACAALCTRALGCKNAVPFDCVVGSHPSSLSEEQYCDALGSCVLNCKGGLNEDDRRCWMTTACANIESEQAMGSGTCPEVKAKIDAQAKIEAARRKVECEPKLAALLSTLRAAPLAPTGGLASYFRWNVNHTPSVLAREVATGTHPVRVTNDVMDGLLCAAEAQPPPPPTVESLFPEFAAYVSKARDGYERKDMEEKFKAQHAKEIEQALRASRDDAERILAPMKAARAATLFLHLGGSVTCNGPICSVTHGPLLEALKQPPLLSLSGREGEQYEAAGLPVREYEGASAEVAKVMREVNRIQVVLSDSGEASPAFRFRRFRFCTSASSLCSPWLASDVSKEERTKAFIEAATSKWKDPMW